MIPLGLKDEQLWAYHAHLRSTHDFHIAVDVLKIDESPIASITPTLLDGQVNIQRGDGVMRTATFVFFDPDRQLHLDSLSPWDGALFADRMLRVRHEVTVPGVGPVEAVPFVGPVVKLSRDGDTVAVECQDKSSLAMTGSKPLKCAKGANAVNQIRRILRDCTGERKFRNFPVNSRKQLPRAFNVGWSDDATPWKVATRIAKNVLGMELFYSADGYATLRKRGAPAASIAVHANHLTSRVQAEFDITSVKNRVMVSGAIQGSKSGKDNKTGGGGEIMGTNVSAIAQIGPPHPLRPAALGRNSVPRWFPLVIAGQKFMNMGDAKQLATSQLNANLPMTAGVKFDMIPVFHLDVGDVLRVETDAGLVNVALNEGSIPLGVSGSMSVGQRKRLARGRRA